MLGPVVVDVAGKELTETDRRRLRHPLVGMVILFSRNYDSPEQLRRLCTEIREVREPRLLITVDHEGGRVQRFRSGFTRLPPMAALGKIWETDVLRASRTALATGFVLATELLAHGVDMSFTPVVDLDWGKSAVIGDRAFHADPRVVSWLANQVGFGLALAGMSNCGKHFPGHGWARADSHFELPIDERSLEQILQDDGGPYEMMGIALDAVMPAHIIYPAVDASPAGFSRHWIQDILRERLGFTGAIFSDDLSMAGARAAGDVVQAARAALSAGCDFILVCNDLAGADRVLESIEWEASPEFAERRARLVPRLGGLTPDELMHSTTYRRALTDLQAEFA